MPYEVTDTSTVVSLRIASAGVARRAGLQALIHGVASVAQGATPVRSASTQQSTDVVSVQPILFINAYVGPTAPPGSVFVGGRGPFGATRNSNRQFQSYGKVSRETDNRRTDDTIRVVPVW